VLRLQNGGKLRSVLKLSLKWHSNDRPGKEKWLVEFPSSGELPDDGLTKMQ